MEKAWVGFRAAKRLENDEDMKLYASIIQRLEKELKIEVNDFPELGLCACDLRRIQRKKKTKTKKSTQNWELLIHGVMKRCKRQRKTKTIIEKLTLTVCNSQEEEHR